MHISRIRRFLLIMVLGLLSNALSPCAVIASKPNVLFIAIDDLNDWIGCLGGHPQAITPNIDRLGRSGMLFTNAHCPAPLCGPSRNAIFTGMQPFQTGMYSNDDKGWHRKHPEVILLPRHFSEAGYDTLGTGKLMHGGSANLFHKDFFPEQRWSPFTSKQSRYMTDELHSKGSVNPRHVIRIGDRQYVLPFNRMPSDRNPNDPKGESFDWGPVEVPDHGMGDGQITDWAIDQLINRPAEKSFFMAVGYYRPHIPLYAPKKYFDLYEGIEIRLPPVRKDDLDDLGPVARKWALEAVTAGAHETVLNHRQWRAAVKGYLACVSFVDAQVGRLLQMLIQSPHAGNTWVVLWSDHGWHLGEKQHWGKWTGWQRSTRVPLIIVPPSGESLSGFSTGGVCGAPVSLIDLYPTLIDLCGLPPRKTLAGRSLKPLLKDPDAMTNPTVITTFDRGNHSIAGRRWHYIRYADGSEELYDLETDPNEWTNLTESPEHDVTRRRMARELNMALGR